MADSASHLLTLIDAYAAARADRDFAYREYAGWAFDDAHRQMIAARDAVADALGIADPPPLSDELTASADRRAVDDVRRQAGLASIRAGLGNGRAS